MRDFKELRVWAKAHQLTLTLYKATTDFPKEELYGLTGQILAPVHLYLPTSPKAAAEIAKRLYPQANS
jgi:hypothetical protein